MALMPCPTCDRQVSQLAVACPGCGHPIASTSQIAPLNQQTESSGTPTWLVVIGIIFGCLAVLLFIGYLVGSTPEAQEREKDRAAVELCRNELKEQAIGSGTASFVRSTCEMMASKFEQQYGSRP